MLSDYNKNVDEILKENEKLKLRFATLESKHMEYACKLATTTEENSQLKQERDHFRELSSKLENTFKNKIKATIIPDENLVVAFDNDPDYLLTIQNSSMSVEEKKKMKELYDKYDNLKKNYKSVSTESELLKQENELLSETLLEYNSEKRNLKICLNCKEQFSPLLNNENSCFYHPGKLKYYSCRGCGADDYFSCCLRCATCQKGCKNTKHVSIS